MSHLTQKHQILLIKIANILVGFGALEFWWQKEK